MVVRKEQVTQAYMTSQEATLARFITVDIYCRVSSEEQEDNTSLKEQERVCREFCKEHGLIVGEVHKEVYSGYVYREREKLDLMRQRYRDGKIQGVVIRTYDRLSRKEVHLGILLEEMEYYDVTLYCVKEQLDDSWVGKMTRVFLGLLAEWEREKILDRTATGRANRAKEGKMSSVTGYKLMYGFQWHDPETKDYIVINERQAKIIREIAERYANGESCQSIIRDLTARGIPSPGQEAIAAGRKPREGDSYIWNDTVIRKTLTDPRITGKGVAVFNTHNSGARNPLEPVPIPDGTYPAIISEELYQRILQRAKTNQEEASRKGKNPEEFLLRAGFIKCHCGLAMVGGVDDKRYSKRKEAFVIRYVYRCSSPKCNYKVNSKKLDAMIWAKVEKLADRVDLIEQAVKLATSDNRLYHDARSVEASLGTERQRAKNYQTDLEEPSLTGDTRRNTLLALNATNKKIRELEEEKNKLTLGMIDKQKEREAYETILAWCRKVKAAKEAKGTSETSEQPEPLTYDQKRDFFRLLGLAVQVEKRNLKQEEIAYKTKVKLPQIQALLPQNIVLSEPSSIMVQCP
jgi:site-specific DNA recombinase